MGNTIEAMLIVYKACILSRIDYGVQAYGCASPHLLQQLNIKQLNQNKTLRIIAKVPDNVSAKSLEVEFNIMSLQYRRKLQHLKHYLKIHSLKINHPVQDLMPVETRPGQCLKYNFKVNDSFATIANKIEVEAGIDDTPVAMHHVNLPIDCHAPFVIKQNYLLDYTLPWIHSTTLTYHYNSNPIALVSFVGLYTPVDP